MCSYITRAKVPLFKKDAKMGAEQLGMGMLGGMLGMFEKEQQNQQQERLMDIQKQNQMDLNKQMQKIQQENWENTNYDAQRKQMEKAGLNVGLMYGGQGGGGMVMSSGSGGNAANGTPPQAGVATGMALQMANLQAQTEVAKAQARNLNADADEKEGKNPKGAGVVANLEADKNLKQLEYKLKTEGFDATLYGMKAEADKKQSEARSSLMKANADERTIEAEVEKRKAESINEAFKLAVMQSGIKLNDAQMQNMLEQVKIGKANAEKITTDQVAGKQLNSLIEKIYDIFGVKNETIK